MSYVNQGNHAKDNPDLAMDFLEGLNKTGYLNFVIEIHSNIAKG